MSTPRIEYPTNQPILITKNERDCLAARFEREVIDPIFFGHDTARMTEQKIKRVQRVIDATSSIFYRALAEDFEVSNHSEITNNKQ